MNAQAADLNGKPTVISVFAGCGGSSLGYKLAGYRELLAVEWDNNAAKTFALNFPGVPLYHGDICKLTSEKCMELAGVAPGELDVLDGSPPCQGFSTAGKRKHGDERNQLFREYARLIDDLQPRVFVMENVSGMVKGHMKQTYLQCIRTLRECGYRAKGQVMNAMHYNVPQSRQRVVIVGVRNDLGTEASHPRPQTAPIPVGPAIAVVTPKTMAPLPRGAGIVFPYISIGKSAIQCVPRSILLKYIPRMVNNKTFVFDGICKRLDPRKPSGTLIKTFAPYAESFIHPYEDRYLSIEELAAVGSFPKTFKWTGRYKNDVSTIGNSVPPNLMRAIAEHIKTNILNVTGATK